MSIKLKGVPLTVAVILGIAGLFVGIFVAQHLNSKKPFDVAAFHGTYLSTPRAVNTFNLTGTDQQSFDNTSLKGHWTIIFFGFTNCGSICPTTMAELGKMYRILVEKGVKELPHVVMISIDPERDNVAKLKHYVTSFEPDFYGATGNEAVIMQMTKEMGIAYAKIANKDDPEHYDMQHTGALMLFNPQGELNAFFTMPHHAHLLAEDYELLVS